MKHIIARLEMVKNDKIVYGKSMYGENAEIGDLVKHFFDKMPDCVDQTASLRVSGVERY